MISDEKIFGAWESTGYCLEERDIIAFAQLIEAKVREETSKIQLTEELFEQIMTEARRSFRRHMSSVRGQQITMWDGEAAHIVAAAIRKGGE